MSSRRLKLLDAAISLLGEHGVHGLTHRAVDALAGVPAGSAANYFRTRDALMTAVVERFAARERAAWDDIAARLTPTSPQELAVALAEFAKESTGPNRSVTLARYAILVEAANRPELRAQLGETGARVMVWAHNWMRAAGSPDPERDAPLVMNYWTGLVLHELSNPDPRFDPLTPLTVLVTTLVPAIRQRRRS